MAENKKKVILYCDIINTVEKLKDSDAGKLFKHYLRYVNDRNPESPNQLIEIVFEPIKQQLKRDLKNYEETCIKNSENAKKRWDKENAKNAAASKRMPLDTKNADTDTDKDTKKINIEFLKFWELYPTKIGKAKCEPKWKSLTNEERELIINDLPYFSQYKPFDSYNHPNPETYLNQKRWQDERPKKPKAVVTNNIMGGLV